MDARASLVRGTTTSYDASGDVEVGAMFGREGERSRRGREGWGGWARACACAVGVTAAAAIAARGWEGGRVGVPALGVQPDARGMPPPETSFIRKARRAFGAALMRANYHQTASASEARTVEAAEALADREAMREIEDEDFEEEETSGGDVASDARSAPARDRDAPPREQRRAGGGGFLSTRARRVRERARAREVEKKLDAETEASVDDVYDDDSTRVEARATKESAERAAKYYKSINGGYFNAAEGGPHGDDEDEMLTLGSLHNKPGVIPGLIDHLQANGAQVGQMRVVTYSNSAYWPVAKIFIDSAKKLPDFASALTVMVTDRETLKECVSTGVMCFLDEQMIEILGDHMNKDGSIKAGETEMAGSLGRALRIVWTWRKVHVVHTLVSSGYGCLYLDASTVMLRDPRMLVKEKLDAGALLVTLSDFGGVLQQKAINTGLIAASPNEYIGKLLEDWMALEPKATDTEQAALTWNIAPNARADGVIITTLSQDVAPSYLTFDVTKHLGQDEKTKQHRGYLVHAAYCGSIPGKAAFLKRVSQLMVDSQNPALATAEENAGCDVYDRHKFFTCGLAPWDGDCE